MTIARTALSPLPPLSQPWERGELGGLSSLSFGGWGQWCATFSVWHKILEGLWKEDNQVPPTKAKEEFEEVLRLLQTALHAVA